MTWWRFQWDNPRILLAVLTAVTLLVLLVAASTSTIAFGTYNPAWDGASDLRAVARDVGTDVTVARNLEAYRESRADTVAIILAPRTPYSTAEVATVRRFVEEGGTLVIADDFGPTANRLLAALGAESRIDRRLVRDERHFHRSPALPVATDITPHPLTAGVDRLTANHPSSVDPNGATVLVRTSPFAYVDGNRDGELGDDETLGPYPLVTVESIGDGTLVVAGDPSLFINVMVNQPGNVVFVRNLFSPHRTAVLDYSHAGGLPPVTVGLLVLRETRWLQLLVGLGGISLCGLWAAGRLPGLQPGSPEPLTTDGLPTMSEDAMVAYLRRRHPDWDDDRVNRVVRGIMSRGPQPRADE